MTQAPSAGDAPTQGQRLQREWEADAELEVIPVNLSLRATRTLSRTLSTADVIHLAPSSRWADGLLVRAAAMLRRPLVQHVDVSGAHDLTRAARLGRRDVSMTVVNSVLASNTLARLGIRSTMIPDPIDPDAVAFRERDPLRPRLLCVRDFEPLDNVAATVRAFAIVQGQVPDATLTLVGSGSQEPTLRALVDDLRLRHVVFAAARPEVLAAAYRDHDLLIQSPNVDNSATSVLHAFACGLPVVSTMAGSVPAVLTHGVQGLLAPLADYETLGHHVLRLLAHPAASLAMARAARPAGDACRWPHVREQWLETYARARLHTYRRSLAAAAPSPSSADAATAAGIRPLS